MSERLVTRPDLVAYVGVGKSHIAAVDVDDLELVRDYYWQPLVRPGGAIYAHAKPGPRGSGSIYMHRLIAGTPPGMETDHRNGDGLDNQRSNLRTATSRQNKANAPKRATWADGRSRTSRFKGVSWGRTRGRWLSKIRIGGRSTNLGRFFDEENAARAYDEAARREFGEFAWLNFPDQEQSWRS